ncbi:MAG: hypothetical protein EAZ70_11065 [Runella slithyformis]|nr:MAG: hypothetical protein EAY79_11715 [Runella slithyformis]TAF02560.1 MAG: hypothetical protein EAZ80_00905 [Runella slithyformis]TAF24907.1 MAG: hypothetical protein EAZ70_11065 [Runella slithyformis]TAF48870.1 MAG: hypothetical protein EAZ63_03435 [Runella slithyformis]TAF79765.1 MAG: hypothetical protein EAZ50_10480 [Runella slithyformis]
MAIIARLCKVDIGKLMPEDMQVEISAPSIQEDALKINALELYQQLFELKDNLLKSKDELIASQKKAYEALKKENQALKVRLAGF